MTEIQYKDISKLDKYWLVFPDPDRGPRHVDLESCANSFEKAVGSPAPEGMRIVGYRYAQGGSVYYELFTVGHLLIRCRQGLLAKLTGKDPRQELEQRLNAGGWMTLEKK